VIGAVVSRAWNGEDEGSLAFKVQGSATLMPLSDTLPADGPI